MKFHTDSPNIYKQFLSLVPDFEERVKESVSMFHPSRLDETVYVHFYYYNEELKSFRGIPSDGTFEKIRNYNIHPTISAKYFYDDPGWLNVAIEVLGFNPLT